MTVEDGEMSVQPQVQTVDDVLATNTLRIRKGSKGRAIATGLLSHKVSGAPVIDHDGKFIGFISEFDLLGALQYGQNLDTLKAEDIMTKFPQSIVHTTSIEDAVTIMRENHFLNLPVENNGVVTKTITRHDLLRAWLGIDINTEWESWSRG